MSPQRMRMIVDAFEETLEIGLEKKNQTVVSMRTALRTDGVTAR